MPQAIWTGSISFGLINIPVKLYPATKPGDVRFREVQRGTGRRIRHRRVVETAEPHVPSERPEPRTSREPLSDRDAEVPDRALALPSDSEVDRDEVVKGFDLGDEGLVTVTDEELWDLRPERSDTIDLEEFVGLEEIDPVFFERSYYLAPRPGMGAEKPYVLLLRALEDSRKLGVARFVLRTKEHLAAIRPVSGALALETLFYLDEVRSASEIVDLPADLEIADREVQLANQLIDTLSGSWRPDRYRDGFRERVLELIGSKAARAIPAERTEPEAPSRAPVSDLMEALRASVETVKEARRTEAG
jgi:DNA end-binding protein Ku